MREPHQREQDIFDAAFELPPEKRAAYLAQAASGDDAMRERIESLLKSYEAGNFLEQAAASTLRRTVLIPVTEKPGDRIGRYKLLQQIGEGGCGIVYLAEQEEPVRRRVALKVIKLGMDTKSVIARFEAERQALALMDHPNIAKVFDAGATEAGRPYFVMELVRGFKITDYCDEHQLSTAERLKLFIQVCGAVQHAHQKGIIHRDIKPSNILVTVNDGVAVPKVIDFGIAKATGGQQLTDKTLFTAFEQFIGTPAYMSPEQAVMTSLDVDTRSDIYSLGVLLYELLTGKTPFEMNELLAAGLDEIRRTLRDKEPPRPSARLTAMAAGELTTLAQRRRTDPPKLIYTVRGDLDWIVMMTLEKDRNRRYETASGLARDIERHLQNEPVGARPPGNFYRFQKMVRRNKFAFGAFGAVVAALVFGLGLSLWILMREKQQHAIATVALQESKASEAKARIAEQSAETTTRQLLEAVNLFNGNDRNPTNKAAFLRSVLEVQRRVLGKNTVEMVSTMMNLASTLDAENKAGEAEQAWREALKMRTGIPGEESPVAADVLGALGEFLLAHGKTAEAQESFQQALALFRQNGTNSMSLAKTIVLESIQDNPLEITNAPGVSSADFHYEQQFYQKINEALNCLQNLKEQDQLPGWLKDEHGQITVIMAERGGEPAFDPEIYPISTSFFGTKETNDVSIYHYTVVQASKDSPWKLQRAWRTSSDDKIIKEYSIK